MYSQIYEILQKYKIHRAAYHGGDLNGKVIKNMMEHSDNIMGDVREYLIMNKSPTCNISNNKIGKITADCCLLLKIWDACFSAVSKLDLTEKDCTNAQEMINLTVALSQEMKLIITHKQHGMENTSLLI